MGEEGRWWLGGAGPRSPLGEQWGMMEVEENNLNFRRGWQTKAELAFVEDMSSLAVNICV